MITWEAYEGEVHGYNDEGAEVVTIGALQDRAACAKWNEPYRPGRAWSVLNEENETVARGRATDIRAAKTAALNVLLSRGAL